jgi:hypothetical protein
LFQWQTLFAGLLALVAAIVSVKYLRKQINQTEQLEAKRRARKLAAIRASGPLALAAIADYAEGCVKVLTDVYRQCGEDPGVTGASGIKIPALPSLPKDTVTLFSEFIEYSESPDADLIEELMRDMQVMQTRMSKLSLDIQNPNMTTTKTYIEGNLIRVGAIHARGAAAFKFFRRMSEALPTADITWAQIKSALRSLDVDENRYPEVYARLDRRAEQSSGPKLWADRTDD